MHPELSGGEVGGVDPRCCWVYPTEVSAAVAEEKDTHMCTKSKREGKRVMERV